MSLRAARPGEPGTPALELLQRVLDDLMARRVLAFVLKWGYARDHAEGFDALPVTEQVRAYMAAWGEPERTTWRYLHHFREALPEAGATPAPLYELLMELLGDTMHVERAAAVELVAA